MDYSDMVESHKRNNSVKEELVDLTPSPGYYDGCRAIDWELEKLCEALDRNATIQVMPPDKSEVFRQRLGRRPMIAKFVDITKTMTQGSGGGIVSLC